ncbi:hypothetical protein MKK84_08585 [Methylobacterium sp. E-065]|uniref:hypothetical protein n=1 Tax=Methylobacterium sp. E-065 TaxID=2836583 RepID=UPI001FB95A50|nr:hypothetical protein [Methylobacterium sp. E-065]MCJ2017479.1 hypothetical protein [Methylobacterium sp. E-065]
MIFILAAAMGIVTARWLGLGTLVLVAVILAIAVGVEGAVEARSLFKVLKRGLEISLTFQGTYLATICVMLSKQLLDARK